MDFELALSRVEESINRRLEELAPVDSEHISENEGRIYDRGFFEGGLSAIQLVRANMAQDPLQALQELAERTAVS